MNSETYLMFWIGFISGCLTGGFGASLVYWLLYGEHDKQKNQSQPEQNGLFSQKTQNMMSYIERRGKEIETMYDELKRM